MMLNFNILGEAFYMKKKILVVLIICVFLVFGGYKVVTNTNINQNHEIGEVLDSFDSVSVYYNGGVNHFLERNVTKDGYNLGLKYQCVEFVKRYYYQHLNHKMPDSYGHAKDFFNFNLADGELNKQRNLIQYRNGGKAPPEIGDIFVYRASITNPYGHVAIVSGVDFSKSEIEIIQQNPGPFSDSREIYSIEHKDGKWFVINKRVLGWLHKI